MSNEAQLAKLLDRLAVLTRTDLIRENDEQRHARHGGWSREEGLEARIGILEDAIVGLEKVLT